MEAWQDSPHAKTTAQEVNCEACHGAYVEDHPQEGVMQLGVDSGVCKDCHAETYEQWENSSHGQANVQCISCHQSHSQEFRLTDETLCQTCHREQQNDFTHVTHAEANLACTNCHLSTTSAEVTSSAGAAALPNHSFEVASKACVDCHEQAATQSAFRPVKHTQPPDNQVGELQLKLKGVEQSNQSLHGLSVAGLGLGLGIGGILGITFVLLMGRWSQRSVKL
jgi:hypothetical protein